MASCTQVFVRTSVFVSLGKGRGVTCSSAGCSVFVTTGSFRMGFQSVSTTATGEHQTSGTHVRTQSCSHSGGWRSGLMRAQTRARRVAAPAGEGLRSETRRLQALAPTPAAETERTADLQALASLSRIGTIVFTSFGRRGSREAMNVKVSVGQALAVTTDLHTLSSEAKGANRWSL